MFTMHVGAVERYTMYTIAYSLVLQNIFVYCKAVMLTQICFFLSKQVTVLRVQSTYYKLYMEGLVLFLYLAVTDIGIQQGLLTVLYFCILKYTQYAM